jgi:hypothetical protein
LRLPALALIGVLALPLPTLAQGGPVVGAAPPVHFGRLFTTPAERERLDAMRLSGGQVASAPAMPVPAVPGEAAPLPPPPPPQPVTLNGVVQRSGGASTIWVNQEARTGAEIRVAPGTREPAVVVSLPNGGKAILKPGQQVDPNTGAVRDATE